MHFTSKRLQNFGIESVLLFKSYFVVYRSSFIAAVPVTSDAAPAREDF